MFGGYALATTAVMCKIVTLFKYFNLTSAKLQQLTAAHRGIQWPGHGVKSSGKRVGHQAH